MALLQFIDEGLLFFAPLLAKKMLFFVLAKACLKASQATLVEVHGGVNRRRGDLIQGVRAESPAVERTVLSIDLDLAYSPTMTRAARAKASSGFLYRTRCTLSQIIWPVACIE